LPVPRAQLVLPDSSRPLVDLTLLLMAATRAISFDAPRLAFLLLFLGGASGSVVGPGVAATWVAQGL
jgi:hypothetical protein